eukprot:GHVU01100686.1.p1 GENE.GHVU01100686.1~~GHVU01100686.1.p1  ORF type:complete len:107 (+),score=0.94 GHVU01100686.1:31-351(+)
MSVLVVHPLRMCERTYIRGLVIHIECCVVVNRLIHAERNLSVHVDASVTILIGPNNACPDGTVIPNPPSFESSPARLTRTVCIIVVTVVVVSFVSTNVIAPQFIIE